MGSRVFALRMQTGWFRRVLINIFIMQKREMQEFIANKCVIDILQGTHVVFDSMKEDKGSRGD